MKKITKTTKQAKKELYIELAKELFLKTSIVGVNRQSVQELANECLSAAIIFYGEMDLFLED